MAEKLGQDTPLPSLETAIEENGLNCGAGYGCAYTNTISWKTPTLPLPMEHNPQVLFEKLFGEGSTPEERLARKQQSRSLLDSVKNEIASLNVELPASDRARMADYLDDVREIERRIQKAEEQTPKDLTAARRSSRNSRSLRRSLQDHVRSSNPCVPGEHHARSNHDVCA